MDRVKRLLLRIALSLASGALALGLVAVLTRTPAGASTGFPLPWSTPVSPCAAPNPFSGCGFSCSLPIVLLDYGIWVALIFVLLRISEGARSP